MNEGIDIKDILSQAEVMSTHPIMILGDDRTILYTNDAIQEIFGNIKGQNAGILFANDDEANYDKVIGLYRRSAGAIEMKIADVDYALEEVKIKSGGGNYLVVRLEDISEKKYLENQVNERLSRYQTDANMAGILQKNLLPSDGEYWNHIKMNSLFIPAENLSGDAYDIIRLSDHETLFYIADVSGHGIQASLLTIYINEKVRSNAELALQGLDLLLVDILKGFNTLGLDARIYMSILCCKYDKKFGELSISNAGHNCAPLILRKTGRVEEVPVRGMPISIISDPDLYTEEIISIAQGDRVILYTDGITEEHSTHSTEVFGSEGVRRVAESNAIFSGDELAARIISEASKYMVTSAKDDRTLLVAEIM